MEPSLDNPTPPCETKGCKELSCFSCDDESLNICSYCLLLHHFDCEATRLELNLENSKFNFIVEGQGNPFNQIPMVLEGYIINKFILEIMQRYFDGEDKISNEGISKLFECEQNCLHSQTQIYETKFGNEGDRLKKVIRRSSNVILGFKNLISKEDFSRISPDAVVSERLGKAMKEDIKYKLNQRISLKQTVERMTPGKRIIEEIEDSVEGIEGLLDETEKEEISYEQIEQLYLGSNNEPLETPLAGHVNNTDIILDFPLHSKQYENVLKNLKNFIIPKVKGLSVSSLSGDNPDLIELCEEGLTGTLEIASLSGFFRKGPRFKKYLTCLLPKVTQEIFIGWFTFEKRDLETLIKETTKNSKLCLERCHLLIPHNDLSYFSEEERKFVREIPEEEILDFRSEAGSRLANFSLYDTKFSQKAFEGFVKALDGSPVADSVFEIYVYRIDVPKQIVEEITKNSKYEIVFA